MSGDVWDIIAPVAGAALGSVVPGVGTALGAAVGSGLSSGIKTGDPLAGLASAGGSFLGSTVAGPLIGDALGGATVGSTLGSGVGSVLPDVVANAGLGPIIGGSVGSSLGESLFAPATNSQLDMPSVNNAGPSAPAPYVAKQENALQMPGSFSQFANLSPTQLSTNIATQGVYGGGLGESESDYFYNMVNRKLVDEAGNVDTGFGDLAPIEQSYLNKSGFGGYNKPYDLLEALSRRSA